MSQSVLVDAYTRITQLNHFGELPACHYLTGDGTCIQFQGAEVGMGKKFQTAVEAQLKKDGYDTYSYNTCAHAGYTIKYDDWSKKTKQGNTITAWTHPFPGTKEFKA